MVRIAGREYYYIAIVDKAIDAGIRFNQDERVGVAVSAIWKALRRVA
jgi:hypothetical protein